MTWGDLVVFGSLVLLAAWCYTLSLRIKTLEEQNRDRRGE